MKKCMENKRCFHKNIILSTCIVCIFILSACQNTQSIIGKWTSGNEYKIFYEDGRYEEGTTGSNPVSAEGTYTLNGDHLTTTIFGESFGYRVEFDGSNEMHLTSESNDMLYFVWKRE